MKKGIAAAAIAATVGLTGASASGQSVNFDFTAEVELSPTQAPGKWYTDRYAPTVFQRAAFGYASDGFALQHGIRGADQQPGSFQNTQGRKYDLGLTASSTTNVSMSIDIFVDDNWQPGTRAGMWSTQSTASIDGGLAYPIIEYAVGADMGGSSYTGFRYWDSGVGWVATSLTNPTTDMWYTLQIVLTATGVDLLVDGALITTIDNYGADTIDNVILNAFNFGQDYDVYWDNFTAQSVVIPLPGAAGMALAGMGMIGLRRRR